MKDNKLIAEFMGDTHKSVLNVGKVHKDYSKSWDWLMPVIEKIYSLDSNVDFFKTINIDNTYNEVVEFIKENNQNN